MILTVSNLHHELEYGFVRRGVDVVVGSVVPMIVQEMRDWIYGSVVVELRQTFLPVFVVWIGLFVGMREDVFVGLVSSAGSSLLTLDRQGLWKTRRKDRIQDHHQHYSYWPGSRMALERLVHLLHDIYLRHFLLVMIFCHRNHLNMQVAAAVDYFVVLGFDVLIVVILDGCDEFLY